MARLYKRGDIFYIDYTYEGLRMREAVGKNKVAARKALESRLGDIAQGKFKISPKRNKIDFSDSLTRFLQEIKRLRKPATHHRYVTSAHQILPFFKGARLDEISKHRLEQYRAKRLEAGLTHATINRDFALLRRFFNWAIKRDLFDAQNPLTKIDLGQEPERGIYYFDDDEIIRLLNVSENYPALHLFIVLGINTGLRYAELLNLRWHDLDLKVGLLIIREQKNNRYSTLPINSEVVALLRATKPIGEHVICKEDGSAYRHNIRKSWRHLLQEAAISYRPPHALRHTFCTNLAKSGATNLEMLHLGRWSDLRLIDRYTHLSDRDLRQASEKLAERLKKLGTNPAQAQKMAANIVNINK